ncbi:MAG: peptidylprolyl isomerase [Pseudomonadales bacterium]
MSIVQIRRRLLLALLCLGPFGLLPGAPAGAQATAAADAGANGANEPVVRLVTSLGEIDIQLYRERAPRTVANFLRLVDEGFYNGLIFHRVVANFVIQAGGYDEHLVYRTPPGTVVNESNNGLSNRMGTVAMARLDDPDSADTQFFINVRDNAHLNATPGRPGYTVFGEVIRGFDVVEDIELVDTGIQQGMAGVPDTPVVIIEARRLP